MAVRKRVTLTDIARRAGVHQTTVSLALRNRPELPLATREKIRRLAENMGYRPDPALSALRSQRRSSPAHESRYSIAFVTGEEQAGTWREQEVYVRCFSGILQRAEQLGYQVETFWYDKKSMTRRRATQILRARNISGVLISGARQAGTPDLDWHHFACVSLTQSLEGVPIHVVTNDHLHTIRSAFACLREKGYRRIGFAMTRYSDTHVQSVWSTGYLGEQAFLPARRRVPPYLPDIMESHGFLAWTKKYKPDAVLTIPPHLEILQWLKKDGLRVPEDIGLASLDRPETGSDFSGICQNPTVIGITAMDAVAGLIQRNDLGWPEHPTEILTRGRWIDGKTTCSQ